MSGASLIINAGVQQNSAPIFKYVPVPPGGAIRQALRKDSGADYDFSWQDDPPSDGAFQINAGETISALKVVRQFGDNQVFILGSDSTQNQIDTILGVALSAGDVGALISVARTGYIEDNAWSWSVGRVFLGLNGAITQTPPTTGFLVVIGSAVSPTKILLSISESIYLGV